MSHHPIFIKDLSLTFPHKTCFEGFNTNVTYGEKIAIIGRNGSGKSSLLNMLRNEITLPSDAVVVYVPQVIEDFHDLSGGQRLNKALSAALAKHPNVLLLDEPTNHLDRSNRNSLLKMLRNYPGTLIVASHDLELLNKCIDKLWHIDNGKISVFRGDYANYFNAIKMHHAALESQIELLEKSKDAAHQSLMQEQERAKKSNQRGLKNIKNKKWPTIVSATKATRAQETSGQKKKAIRETQEGLLEQLSELRLPEIITPKFHIAHKELGGGNVVSISNGKVGYDSWIVEDINIQLSTSDRLAILGDNGSGKSTIVRAIMNDPAVKKAGIWHTPSPNAIGYLDQHYSNLDAGDTVLETIKKVRADWQQTDIRKHLNDFLFRKNEEVYNRVSKLSGGEKARLSLAKIAALTPHLLILDEITNNLDLETTEHVKQILSAYPSAMIIISHDEAFIKELGMTAVFAAGK